MSNNFIPVLKQSGICYGIGVGIGFIVSFIFRSLYDHMLYRRILEKPLKDGLSIVDKPTEPQYEMVFEQADNKSFRIYSTLVSYKISSCINDAVFWPIVV